MKFVWWLLLLGLASGLWAAEPVVTRAAEPVVIRMAVDDSLDGALAKLVDKYVETMSEAEPPVPVKVELVEAGPGGGNGALMAGDVDFLTTAERLERATAERLLFVYGKIPLQLPLASRDLTIFVQKGNPLSRRGISLMELDALYSPLRKRGYEGDLNRWGDFGFDDAPEGWRIQACSLGPGTTRGALFRERVLLRGRPSRFVENFDNQKSMIAYVAAGDGGAVGYGGRLLLKDGVAPVPIRVGENLLLPTDDDLWSGKYPLSAPIFVRILEDVRPEVARFLQFLQLAESGKLLKEAGLLPTPAKERMLQVRLLEELGGEGEAVADGPTFAEPKVTQAGEAKSLMAEPKVAEPKIAKEPWRPAPLLSPELQRAMAERAKEKEGGNSKKKDDAADERSDDKASGGESAESGKR